MPFDTVPDKIETLRLSSILQFAIALNTISESRSGEPEADELQYETAALNVDSILKVFSAALSCL